MDIGNNCDTPLSDLDVGVRVERAIIRDDKPLGEESETTAGRDVYPPLISVQLWNETKGSKV